MGRLWNDHTVDINFFSVDEDLEDSRMTNIFTRAAKDVSIKLKAFMKVINDQ